MTELLKAVYYCRVSTDDENQTTSIVNQKTESIKTIQENHWKLIEGYIEMKMRKMIQFDIMNPLKKCGIKGFRNFYCCQRPLFFCA